MASCASSTASCLIKSAVATEEGGTPVTFAEGAVEDDAAVSSFVVPFVTVLVGFEAEDGWTIAGDGDEEAIDGRTPLGDAEDGSKEDDFVGFVVERRFSASSANNWSSLF